MRGTKSLIGKVIQIQRDTKTEIPTRKIINKNKKNCPEQKKEDKYS